MPIFEYRCQKCKEDFEKITFNSKAPITCPRCQSKRVTKKLSAFSFKSGSKAAAGSGASGCGSCSGHHCGSCH